MSECTSLDEAIVDFLDGTLPAARQAELVAHLDACATCRETVRAYRRIQEAYRTAPDADVTPDVAERILVASWHRGATPWRTRSRLLLVAAALLLIAGPVLVFLWPRSDHTTPALVQRDDADEEELPPLIRRGDAERARGELERAAASYESALAAVGDGPEAARILHRLAALDLDRGRAQSAAERLRTVIERYPAYDGRLAALELQGRALERVGDVAQALATYKRATAEFPAATSDLANRILTLEQTLTLQALGYGGN